MKRKLLVVLLLAPILVGSSCDLLDDDDDDGRDREVVGVCCAGLYPGQYDWTGGVEGRPWPSAVGECDAGAGVRFEGDVCQTDAQCNKEPKCLLGECDAGGNGEAEDRQCNADDDCVTIAGEGAVCVPFGTCDAEGDGSALDEPCLDALTCQEIAGPGAGCIQACNDGGNGSAVGTECVDDTECFDIAGEGPGECIVVGCFAPPEFVDGAGQNACAHFGFVPCVCGDIDTGGPFSRQGSCDPNDPDLDPTCVLEEIGD